ncbi:hypothetical protein Scep_010730 [Stephania cephalantha]|uniref:Uncharacterized protein n=1 Tax=Stephania cephalantha TaxID=152367 RepID=A0AAP0JWE5_9MAGN
MDLDQSKEIDDFVDWRGRKVEGNKYGGKRCSIIVCVVEVLENMVFLANATNLVTYLITFMHYPNDEAANTVTNFMGSAFILTLLGGFICDSFVTRFWTFIIFCITELLGLVMLMIQASNPELQPPKDEKPSTSQAAFLYMGLYAIALGFGGIKASLEAHGADQLDNKNKSLISSFFNWFFFSLVTGGFLACTLMVYIEDNKGWNWGFAICIGALTLSLIVFSTGFATYRNKRPSGSPLTRIFKVLKCSVLDCSTPTKVVVATKSHKKFRFLDKALLKPCVAQWEVEETRTFLGLLPIFASTIMMNCCLAQLNTFGVAQGIKMNRKLGHGFEIPPPSLSVIPQVVMLSSIMLFEGIKVVILKKQGTTTNISSSSIFPPLKRIGLGLAMASVSMAVAAIVEVKRREAAVSDGRIVSVFWLGWQYLLLGVSDMLTLGGMLEFFYSEAPNSMRSMSTAFAWCSTSLGFFFSTVIVSIVNAVSRDKWLGGKDLNENRLELFYTVLSVVNILNLLIYMYFAKKY